MVIDHNETRWAARFNRKHHTNGAATYSREIVEHHIPVWQQLLPEDAVISTCPLMTGMNVSGSVAVQYLHTYSYADPLKQIRQVYDNQTLRFDRVIFVTSYKALYERAKRVGYDAVYVPMVVDPDPVRRMAVPEDRRYGSKRALYFGNVTAPKLPEYLAITKTFADAGWTVDLVSKNKFGSQPVTQEDSWRIASRYRYGIGVGRCALEMMALGLKVMISGAHFGGLITTPEELSVQQGTNFNGRVTTFDRDYLACIENMDISLDLTTVNALTVPKDSIATGWLQLNT